MKYVRHAFTAHRHQAPEVYPTSDRPSPRLACCASPQLTFLLPSFDPIIFPLSPLSGLAMAAPELSDKSGDEPPKPLLALLQEGRVPEPLISKVTEAFEEIEDFAFAMPRLEDLDPWLERLPQDTLQALQIPDSATLTASQPAARLRMTLRRAHHACLELADQPPTKTGGLISKQTPPNPQEYTWMEHVPPKLTQERIDELTKRFAEHCPGEILTSDSMPSIRLLSLVHEGLKTRLTWVPWQYRLSAKQYQEIHEAKSHKPLRSEMQILTHAIVDDTPELSLDHRSLSPGWFLRCQTVFRNALALCNAAHLANLKLFDARVAEFALAQPGSGLRGVSTQEVLAADRKLWQAITDLLAKKWTLDDALYEMTNIRNDISSLLQPRPASSITRPAPDSRPAKRPRYEEPSRSKGKPKTKGKGAPPGKGSTSSTPNPNWVESHQGKPICRRYQLGICTATKCKFLHVCAMKGCQGSHPAKDHPANRT